MRRFILYLLVLFLIAAVLRVSFFFTILYLFLGLYLLTRLWTRRWPERLQVQRRFVNRAFFGDRVTVELAVRNAGRLPLPWLELHESLPPGLAVTPLRGQVISLGAGERWHKRYTLIGRRRGYYPIGPLTIKSGDLLGLARTGVERHEPDPLIVYPRVVPLQELGLPTRSPLVALPARTPLFEDPSRVIGVRDYQRGDSPRRIHWTATASVGRLLVKQYRPAIARETLICLDLDEADYGLREWRTATELAIVVAASVAHHVILREGLAVGLATEARDALAEEPERFFLPPRAERGHLMNLLEVLARVQAVRDSSFADLLRRESLRLAWGATLLVITGHESEALIDTLAYLRRAGFAVALVLVGSGRPSEAFRRRAELLKLPVHRVWRERDLEVWR